MICLSVAAASAFAATSQPAKENTKKSESPEAKQPEPFIVRLMTPYFAMRKSLGTDSLKDVSENAAAFTKTLKAEISNLEKKKKPPEELGPLNNILKAATALTGKQTDIKKTRPAFGKLGDALVDYMNKYVGLSYTKDFKIYYCSMSKHYWVQKSGDKMINPYYGKQMVDCGEEVQNSQPQSMESVPGRDSVLKCEPRRN
jgi:hypothetical protein